VSDRYRIVYEDGSATEWDADFWRVHDAYKARAVDHSCVVRESDGAPLSFVVPLGSTLEHELKRAGRNAGADYQLRVTPPDGWVSTGMALQTLGGSRQTLVQALKFAGVRPTIMRTEEGRQYPAIRVEDMQRALEAWRESIDAREAGRVHGCSEGQVIARMGGKGWRWSRAEIARAMGATS
jgi:hypothetical protein